MPGALQQDAISRRKSGMQIGVITPLNGDSKTRNRASVTDPLSSYKSQCDKQNR